MNFEIQVLITKKHELSNFSSANTKSPNIVKNRLKSIEILYFLHETELIQSGNP